MSSLFIALLLFTFLMSVSMMFKFHVIDKPALLKSEIKRLSKKSIGERIEEALPSTPAGCVWIVTRVKKEWWEGWVEVPLVTKNNIIGDAIDKIIHIQSKREWRMITPEDTLWNAVPDKNKQSSYKLEIEFVTPDSSEKIVLGIDDKLSIDDSLDYIISDIKKQCPRLVAAYMNRTADWDGVYIKNGE